MKDLVEHIARTTYIGFNDAAELVNRGLMLGWSIDEMRPFSDVLPEVIECAAAGFSKTQIAGWHKKLRFLIFAYRFCGVSPRTVPNIPPI